MTSPMGLVLDKKDTNTQLHRVLSAWYELAQTSFILHGMISSLEARMKLLSQAYLS